MEFVKVTYRGPSSLYSLEHEGEWYEFAPGREVVVPETLAERLLDVSGHTFEVGDEVRVESEQGTESFSVFTDTGGSGSGEGSGSGDDPDGVKPTGAYGED